MADNVQLGAYIRQLREARGLSQKDAGAKLPGGMWHTRWSQIENGAGTKLDTLVSMARALDTTPEEVRKLFHLAGHGELFEFIARTGRLLYEDQVPPLADVIEASTELDSRGKTIVRAVFEGERAKLTEERRATGDAWERAEAVRRTREYMERVQEDDYEPSREALMLAADHPLYDDVRRRIEEIDEKAAEGS